MTEVLLHGFKANGCVWALGAYGGTTRLKLDDFVFTNPANGWFYTTATGVLTIVGASVITESPAPTITAGSLVEINHSKFGIDISKITQKAVGDQAYNTNGALSYGVGPSSARGQSARRTGRTSPREPPTDDVPDNAGNGSPTF